MVLPRPSKEKNGKCEGPPQSSKGKGEKGKKGKKTKHQKKRRKEPSSFCTEKKKEEVVGSTAVYKKKMKCRGKEGKILIRTKEGKKKKNSPPNKT